MVDTFESERPWLSLIVLDDGDELLLAGVLPSLAAAYQREVEPDACEVVVVTRPDREAALRPLLQELGTAARLGLADDPSRDFAAIGADLARGAYLAWCAAPGVASPLLFATLLAAFAAHPDAVVIIPTIELHASNATARRDWLSSRGWPAHGDTLLVQATLGLSGEARHRWLDPIENPENVAAPRELGDAMPAGGNFVPALLASARGRRVQLVGDALVRPMRDAAAERQISVPSAGGPVDADLEYFGQMRLEPEPSVARPLTFCRRGPTHARISSVLVTYDMRRETPRTLQSLLPGYQEGIEPDDYELILVDNGSPTALSPDEVSAVAPAARYFQLQNAPASPAYALNYGAARASGDILAILSDGASLLSPAVFSQALLAFRAFPRPVVITQYFYLGPGAQADTVKSGYDRQAEDRLLASVAWPEDGYRLFEISAPQTLGDPEGIWLGPWFESDCIIMSRSTFETIGGCDERFDLPGGGLLIMDLLTRACNLADAQPVKLIGEGVFHQFHGGITTSTTSAELEAEVDRYKQQYVALRGKAPARAAKTFCFLGRLRTPAARARMKD